MIKIINKNGDVKLWKRSKQKKISKINTNSEKKLLSAQDNLKFKLPILARSHSPEWECIHQFKIQIQSQFFIISKIEGALANAPYKPIQNPKTPTYPHTNRRVRLPTHL